MQSHVRLGQRERQPLILADRSSEDDTFICVRDRAPYCDPADAEGFRGHEDALGVQAVEQIAKAVAFFADAVGECHRQVVVAHFARCDGIATDLADRTNVDLGSLQIGQQQGHTVGTARTFLDRCGAHQ